MLHFVQKLSTATNGSLFTVINSLVSSHALINYIKKSWSIFHVFLVRREFISNVINRCCVFIFQTNNQDEIQYNKLSSFHFHIKFQTWIWLFLRTGDLGGDKYWILTFWRCYWFIRETFWFPACQTASSVADDATFKFLFQSLRRCYGKRKSCSMSSSDLIVTTNSRIENKD
jgi:hypothetical protein